MLVPTHTALEGPVSVQSAGVSGIDPDIGMRLWQLGAGELDIAASAWTGLLADAGFTVDTAKSVLADARAKTAYLKTSVRVVPGVDSNIESVLEEKGIDSAVKLANADPARLEQELGIHRKAADIVVQEARKVVGRRAWSLDSPDLGLSKDQVKALEEIGITTKGALAEKSADEISQKIGVAADLAEEMIEKTSRAVDTARLKASVTEKAPISVLKEEEGVQLDAALVKNLADSGLKNVRDVATADVKQLAGLVGDRVKAESLVNAAQKRVGLVW